MDISLSHMNEPLEPFPQVPGYQIQRLIGQGTFSKVYAATDTLDIRHPKRALLALIVQGDSEERQIRRRSFKRTAEILENLHHSSIPRIYRFFEHEEGLYIVQEFIDGLNYGEKLNGESPPLPVDEVERVFQETLVGLAALHRVKVVHRDIKPSNLMKRTADGSIAIVDFGSACDLRMASAVATVIGSETNAVGRTQIYTPGYAHPDQQDGLVPATPQWDLYALAKTCLALLFGSDPPWQQSWSLEELGFSSKVQKLLAEMLKTQGCKFVDACDALKFQSEPTEVSLPSTLLPRQRRTLPKGRGKSPSIVRWLVAIAGICVLGAGVGAYLLLVDRQHPNQVAPQCPTYKKSELDIPVPDRGFAVRFYFPETSLAGDSRLEVWRDGNLLAEEKDYIKGFIWIKSLINGADFPPGKYQLRLMVPESIPYEQEVTLNQGFPVYLGAAAALEVACDQS